MRYFRGSDGTIEAQFGFTPHLIQLRQLPTRAASLLLVVGPLANGARLQGEVKSLADEKPPEVPPDTAATTGQNRDRDMGSALRSVYQRTVEETIPSEMLDLLGKLD